MYIKNRTSGGFAVLRHPKYQKQPYDEHDEPQTCFLVIWCDIYLFPDLDDGTICSKTTIFIGVYLGLEAWSSFLKPIHRHIIFLDNFHFCCEFNEWMPEPILTSGHVLPPLVAIGKPSRPSQSSATSKPWVCHWRPTRKLWPRWVRQGCHSGVGHHPFGNGEDTKYLWWWLGDGLEHCYTHITSVGSVWGCLGYI